MKTHKHTHPKRNFQLNTCTPIVDYPRGDPKLPIPQGVRQRMRPFLRVCASVYRISVCVYAVSGIRRQKGAQIDGRVHRFIHIARTLCCGYVCRLGGWGGGCRLLTCLNCSRCAQDSQRQYSDGQLLFVGLHFVNVGMQLFGLTITYAH